MFKIQAKGKPETAIWLNKLETLLSNKGEGDIALSKAPYNDEAIRVKIRLEHEKIYLCDQSFTTNIMVNNKLLPKGSRVLLNHQDCIKIDQDEFQVFDAKQAAKPFTSSQDKAPNIWHLQASGDWLDGQSFAIKGKVIIGRDKSCDLTIPGSHLSRQHAELIVAGNSILLRDLGSSNGCYVNGVRVQEAALRDGDRVSFDTLSFTVVAPAKVSSDKRATVISGAINESIVEEAYTVMSPNKEWVRKPTSVGNQLTNSDLLLAKHLRHQKILYWTLALTCGVCVFGTVLFLYLKH